MSRQCERPDCAARASVAYGFDAARRTAWFADLSAVTGDAATAGALCGGHARAMVLPRGWWLDDRRHTDSSTLFPPAPAQRPAPTREGVQADRQSRTKRRARAASTWANVPLPLEAEVSESTTIDMGSDPLPSTGIADMAARAVAPEGVADAPGVEPSDAVEAVGEPESEVVDESNEADRIVVPWRPRFDQSDDLGGVLAARSPLLARAFSGLRRSAPNAPRDE